MHALADTIQPHGTKVLAQLHHAGERSVPVPGLKTMGPVDIEGKSPVHGMTKEDIVYLTDKFVKAARHAQQGGLDGVELHAGHGYLLSQFLSPLTNKRTDDTAAASRPLEVLVEIIRASADLRLPF